MIFCRYADTKRDNCDELKFFCLRFKRRLDMDMLEKCQYCSEYKSM